MIPFLFGTKYGQGAQRTKPLYIRGAKGFINFLSALEKAYKGWIIPDELNLEEIEEGMIKFGDFTLIARKTAHIESSLAYRIESQGKSLVYSGDTDYSKPLVELAKDTDVLIIECSLPDELKVAGHLTPTEVVKIANESRAKKIIISHLYPICDERDVISLIRGHTDADVILAEDLLEVEI